jgi:hypothetical protein
MKNLVLIFSLMFISTHCFGWGQTGHRVTGEIAEAHLSVKAKKNISDILGHESLALVSTYMDEIKSDPNYRHLDPWHYCTIPTGETYELPGTPQEGDVVNAILQLTNELKSKQFTLGDEAFTLKLLVHLVGDIHQPLHVGNGQDRGGNDIKLEYFWEPSNLHRVWDTGMIDGTRLSYTEYTAWINHPDKTDVELWQSASVVEWAHESMTYRPGIYELPENMKLSYAYDRAHLPTVNLRLLQAGVRLAGLLNEIYG